VAPAISLIEVGGAFCDVGVFQIKINVSRKEKYEY